LVAGESAYAQQTAQPAPAPAEADASAIEESDDIVVLAAPGDQVRIDRRTYTLRDDASRKAPTCTTCWGAFRPSASPLTA
jgi:hypothetical protein